MAKNQTSVTDKLINDLFEKCYQRSPKIEPNRELYGYKYTHVNDEIIITPIYRNEAYTVNDNERVETVL